MKAIKHSILFNFILKMSFLFLMTSISEAQPIQKKIEPTRFCSNMELIDQAERYSENEKANRADYILISKSRKTLYLLNQGRVVKEYPVAFGFGALEGPKFKEGDGRTPEGLYFVESKNSKSKYNLALKVSYPQKADLDFAKKLKVPAGSDIMIHGFPVGFVDNLNPYAVRRIHPSVDWTQGCIGVSDTDIAEIFSIVGIQTPIEICPLEESN